MFRLPFPPPRPAMLGLACGLWAMAVGGAAEAACTGESLRDRLSPAQEEALAAAVAATPYPEGLLWQATRGAETVTLMGTLHIWDPRITDVTQEALDHLSQARLALFEMTPADEGRLAEAIAADPSLVRLPAGERLPDLVAPEVWASLETVLTARGLPLAAAGQLQPWFLANLVAIPTCAMGAVQAGQTGVDHALMQAAEEHGVPMAALEPWDSVLAIFGSMSIEDQIDFLRLSLVAPEIQNALFVAMTDGYFAGRVAEVWELNTIALDFMPGLAGEAGIDAVMQEEMLDQRNHRWLPVIEEAARDHGQVFVGAGAAHLPGENGLLALLAAEGWTLTRLDIR